MKFIDWFAGIGGFRRGLELAGHKCVGFCEYDKYAVASYTSMHLITEAQREYLATLDFKTRQREILKDEYKNGEWFANDICRVDARDIPKADIWCFGFPCQDISVAGKQQQGLQGSRSSLFFRVMYLLVQIPTDERPSYLFIENVKNLLSINGGWDFARLLIELDKNGYDAEWQVLNSKDYVPQNRERIFIVGHLRDKCSSKVLFVEGTGRTNCIQTINTTSIKQIGRLGDVERNNPNQYRVYDTSGISATLNCMEGGGREPSVAIPVLTPERPTTRQCGRRLKENGDPAFTLTSCDVHGVGIQVQIDDDTVVYAVWYPKYNCYIAIRKLTPKECFRLQGWTDDYFEKAEFVNSDSQLYRQAGNGVTVTVIKAIAENFNE